MLPISDREPSPDDLKGRCAVVTGAANGIGLAIARRLRQAGANVVAVDKDERSLKEHFGDLEGYEQVTHDFALGDEHYGGGATNGEAVAESVLARAHGRGFGLPDLIVNNVGIETLHRFVELPSDAYDEVHLVNVRNPLLFTQRLVRELLQKREHRPALRAAILFISSLHDTVPSGRPHYGASKAGVSAHTRELARELGAHRIRVNAISPGWVRTDPDPDSPLQQAKAAALVPRIPMGRPGRPDDVAKLALVLLNDYYSGYVTGVNVPVDGGLSLDTWVPPPGVRWGA